MGRCLYLRLSTIQFTHSIFHRFLCGCSTEKIGFSWVYHLTGDFHHTFNSPCCRDSGNNITVTELYDFEGDPRIAYGIVDMGADEFHTHLYYTGNATPGGNVSLKFIDTPKTSPVILWLGSGVLGTPIPTMFGDWFLESPILLTVGLGSIATPKGISILPFTFDPAFPAMDISTQAGIGTKLTNLCVMPVK